MMRLDVFRDAPLLENRARRSAPYIIFPMPLPEKALIDRIRHAAQKRAGILGGIGDDCAILRIPPGHEALVTTDFSLEGIHFHRKWHSPDSVGHRCLARGLSDIAAMGGIPLAAFLSLALSKEVPQKWVDGFMGGLLRLAKEFGVTLAGGDTAQSPSGIMADIIVLGSAPKSKAIRRSGARPGDKIYVTGTLGGSAAALQMLRAGRKLSPRNFPRHFFPEPRIAVGKFLREHSLATAMIDSSDGLSIDLSHICEESGVGAEIEKDLLPRAMTMPGKSPVDLKLALHGGEDYELIFTAPSKKKLPSTIKGVQITEIGRVTKNRRMLIRSRGKGKELQPQGWEHFP
jgi:thiamine-monophosphate kinase